MTIDRQDTDNGTFYGYKFGSMTEVRYSSAEVPSVPAAPATKSGYSHRCRCPPLTARLAAKRRFLSLTRGTTCRRGLRLSPRP